VVEDGKGAEEISKIMVKTLAVIRQKMMDLKIKVSKEQQQVVSGRKPCFCSSQFRI
jgi:hypothetical protein